jgi:hypothetical protein
MPGRTTPTPEPQVELALGDRDVRTSQRRQKAFVAVSDSESVAAVVAKHGGDRLLAAATLTSSEEGDSEDEGADSDDKVEAEDSKDAAEKESETDGRRK